MLVRGGALADSFNGKTKPFLRHTDKQTYDRVLMAELFIEYPHQTSGRVLSNRSAKHMFFNTHHTHITALV